MSFRKMKLKNESGFSLVELMVVVAIIGILAAMSVGQIGKQVAKARQSEVKSNLAALYTAEKTFQSEFGSYWEQFTPIGFSVEGTTRYNVGFTGGLGVGAGAIPGYTGAMPAANISLISGCPITATCTIVNTNGVPPGVIDAFGFQPPALANTATATMFSAQGRAAIFVATTIDIWTINHNKNLFNAQNGIP